MSSWYLESCKSAKSMTRHFVLYGKPSNRSHYRMWATHTEETRGPATSSQAAHLSTLFSRPSGSNKSNKSFNFLDIAIGSRIQLNANVATNLGAMCFIGYWLVVMYNYYYYFNTYIWIYIRSVQRCLRNRSFLRLERRSSCS